MNPADLRRIIVLGLVDTSSIDFVLRPRPAWSPNPPAPTRPRNQPS